MKKFFIGYISLYSPTIEEVEVIRETEKQAIIFYNGREMRKEKDGHLFNTLEEAKAFYLAKGEAKVEQAENNLEYAKAELAELKIKLGC